MQSSHDNAGQTTAYRVVTAVVGLVFVASAVLILSMGASPDLKQWIAAAIIGLLGLDALVSAFRNKRSLLSRIGPLP
jgi:putative Mn2+ efflux pump MntP